MAASARRGGPSNENVGRRGATEAAVAPKLIHDELRPRQLRGQLCLFMEELRPSSSSP